jgi:hypothetical protein
MGRRIVSVTTQTPTATADTTNLVDATYPFLLQGGLGATTQVNRIWEISISGQAASSSSPTFMILGRDSTNASINSTGAGQTDQSIDGSASVFASVPLVGNTNTTKPQRSATGHLANCSLNAFGGVYFWRANRLEETFGTVGAFAATPLGEISLSAFTGGTTGACGFHMIYETV